MWHIHGRQLKKQPCRDGEAMVDDDELPRKRQPLLQPHDLAPLGVDELRDYVAALSAEIARAEAEITRKTNQRSAAAAFFRQE
jgi:uncharacterized small protein (DUF1192 family)